MPEVWTKLALDCCYQVTGRERKRLKYGWLWNDDEPDPPEWYAAQTGASGWYLRWLWWWRNPCHNLAFYIWGVADQNYILFGSREPVRDGPVIGGWKNHSLFMPDGRVLRYRSYMNPVWGRMLIFYYGYRFDGAFGLKINWKRI